MNIYDNDSKAMQAVESALELINIGVEILNGSDATLIFKEEE